MNCAGTPPSPENYLNSLLSWVESADGCIYSPPSRPDLECYGSGYDHWGVQTNQKAFAAYAVAAVQSGADNCLLDRALKLFRFSMESHIEGSYRCEDGRKWGHTWISPLGIERMMHGVEAIREFFTASDRELMEKVLISECDWLMDGYSRGNNDFKPGEIIAGLVKHNHPESNIWCGALLFRTASLFPGAPRAAEYLEKASRFLVNGISVPGDAESEDTVDGRRVSSLHKGANFFDTFALNHHGYLNIGYMAICLSNTAMLYFFCKRNGIKPPEALFHNAKELWELLKLCTFPDGRLLRIGGDTRVRYSYCQDSCIPVWLMASDVFKDGDCSAFEAGWLETVLKEQAVNGDGSFLSERCGKLGEISPIYYTRLESDRAASLSMGAYWRSIFSFPGATRSAVPVSESWHDDYHGACLRRDPGRIASWTWVAAEPPQGLCLPPGDSSLAEWRQNLSGRITGTGKKNFSVVRSHASRLFPGGFLTWGESVHRSEDMVAEGHQAEDLALQKTAFAALPDGASVLVIQHAPAADRRIYTRSVKGLFLNVPNDIFNGGKRVYRSESGRLELGGLPGREEIISLDSSWVNVDGVLSVINISPEDKISVYRPADRQIGLSRHPAESNPLPGGMLYADEICSPCMTGTRSFDPGDLLYDARFMLRTGMDADGTREFSAGGRGVFRPGAPEGVCSAGCLGADGYLYMLFLNVGSEEKKVKTDIPSVILSSGDEVKPGAPVPVRGGEAVLLRSGIRVGRL